MKNLEKLQQEFIDGIYDNKKDILDSIKPRISSKERFLGVYQNNLYLVLIESLVLTYKYLYKFLGEEKFRELARRFARKYRSKSGNLDDYGQEFPEFLLSETDNQFYHDLAKISWLEQESYLSEDEEDFDVLALQSLEQEKLFDVKFKLSKNCFLFESDYNLFAKTNSNKKREEKYYYLIHRINKVKTEKISKKEYDFLIGVERNLTLYEIYEKYACDIEKSLQQYIQNQVLKSFSV